MPTTPNPSKKGLRRSSKSPSPDPISTLSPTPKGYIVQSTFREKTKFLLTHEKRHSLLGISILSSSNSTPSVTPSRSPRQIQSAVSHSDDERSTYNRRPIISRNTTRASNRLIGVLQSAEPSRTNSPTIPSDDNYQLDFDLGVDYDNDNENDEDYRISQDEGDTVYDDDDINPVPRKKQRRKSNTKSTTPNTNRNNSNNQNTNVKSTRLDTKVNGKRRHSSEVLTNVTTNGHNDDETKQQKVSKSTQRKKFKINSTAKKDKNKISEDGNGNLDKEVGNPINEDQNKATQKQPVKSRSKVPLRRSKRKSTLNDTEYKITEDESANDDGDDYFEYPVKPTRQKRSRRKPSKKPIFKSKSASPVNATKNIENGSLNLKDDAVHSNLKSGTGTGTDSDTNMELNEPNETLPILPIEALIMKHQNNSVNDIRNQKDSNQKESNQSINLTKGGNQDIYDSEREQSEAPTEVSLEILKDQPPSQELKIYINEEHSDRLDATQQIFSEDFNHQNESTRNISNQSIIISENENQGTDNSEREESEHLKDRSIQESKERTQRLDITQQIFSDNVSTSDFDYVETNDADNDSPDASESDPEFQDAIGDETLLMADDLRDITTSMNRTSPSPVINGNGQLTNQKTSESLQEHDTPSRRLSHLDQAQEPEAGDSSFEVSAKKKELLPSPHIIKPSIFTHIQPSKGQVYTRFPTEKLAEQSPTSQPEIALEVQNSNIQVATIPNSSPPNNNSLPLKNIAVPNSSPPNSDFLHPKSKENTLEYKNVDPTTPINQQFLSKKLSQLNQSTAQAFSVPFGTTPTLVICNTPNTEVQVITRSMNGSANNNDTHQSVYRFPQLSQSGGTPFDSRFSTPGTIDNTFRQNTVDASTETPTSRLHTVDESVWTQSPEPERITTVNNQTSTSPMFTTSRNTSPIGSTADVATETQRDTSPPPPETVDAITYMSFQTADRPQTPTPNNVKVKPPNKQISSTATEIDAATELLSRTSIANNSALNSSDYDTDLELDKTFHFNPSDPEMDLEVLEKLSSNKNWKSQHWDLLAVLLQNEKVKVPYELRHPSKKRRRRSTILNTKEVPKSISDSFPDVDEDELALRITALMKVLLRQKKREKMSKLRKQILI